MFHSIPTLTISLLGSSGSTKMLLHKCMKAGYNILANAQSLSTETAIPINFVGKRSWYCQMTRGFVEIGSKSAGGREQSMWRYPLNVSRGFPG